MVVTESDLKINDFNTYLSSLSPGMGKRVEIFKITPGTEYIYIYSKLKRFLLCQRSCSPSYSFEKKRDESAESLGRNSGGVAVELSLTVLGRVLLAKV